MTHLRRAADRVKKIGDIRDAFADFDECEFVETATVDEVDLGRGCARITLKMTDGLYYQVLSELSGFEIDGEESLIDLLRELAGMKASYDKVSEALRDCDERGYGIVMPDVSDMHLDEPEIVRQSGGYGVRLRASASSIHMIRANIEAEVSPIVGTEQQSEDMVRYMLREFDEDPSRIWESNMFGKSLYELVGESIHTKLAHMPEASRVKLSETLERIINEGSGGLICILL
jgi:stage IV sporulation protein A